MGRELNPIPKRVSRREFLIGQADSNSGDRGNHPRHSDYGHVTVILAGRSRRVTLDSINNPVIQSKVSADRFESMPPSMVRLDTFVHRDRSNKFNYALVTTLCEQRAIFGTLDETQQAQSDQMLMYWHQPVRPRFYTAGQWVEIENVVPGLLADIFLAQLQRLGNPAAAVTRYGRSPSLCGGSLGILFRLPHVGKASIEYRLGLRIGEALGPSPDFLFRFDLDDVSGILGQLPIINRPAEY